MKYLTSDDKAEVILLRNGNHARVNSHFFNFLNRKYNRNEKTFFFPLRIPEPFTLNNVSEYERVMM